MPCIDIEEQYFVYYTEIDWAKFAQFDQWKGLNITLMEHIILLYHNMTEGTPVAPFTSMV